MLLRKRNHPKHEERGVDVGRLPVKWVDKSILVAEQSLINPPYTPESVISVSAALNGSTEDNARSANVERVKHVVCDLLLTRFNKCVVAERARQVRNWCYVKGTR